MRRTSTGRVGLAVLAVVAAVAFVGGCRPVDANPDHVQFSYPLQNVYRIENHTSYTVRIDSAQLDQAPAAALTYSPPLIPAGGTSQSPVALPPSLGSGSVQVSFTLLGSHAADGLPVTGSLKFTWVAQPIS